MELVSTGPGDNAGCRARVGAVFRRCRVRQDAEFSDGIDRNLEGKSSIHPIHILNAVQQEVIRLGTLAIDRVGLSTAKRSALCRQTCREWRHARLQQPQLRKITAIERQIENFSATYHFPESVRGRIDGCGRCRYLNGFPD